MFNIRRMFDIRGKIPDGLVYGHPGRRKILKVIL
jgi:hypothetical protein